VLPSAMRMSLHQKYFSQTRAATGGRNRGQRQGAKAGGKDMGQRHGAKTGGNSLAVAYGSWVALVT
jgi:hypothetical protein